MRLVSAIRRNSSIIKNIFRLIIYILLISTLAYQIHQLRGTFRILPRESLVQSTEIPFPGVTVCPPFVTNKKIYNRDYLKQLNLTDAELNLALLSACPNTITHGNLMIDVDIMDVLLKISPDFEDTIYSCRVDDYAMFFQGCERLLVKSVTDYGICYTFNMLDHDLVFTKDISSDFDTFKHTKIAKNWKPIRNNNESHFESNEQVETWSLEMGYMNDNVNIQPVRATKSKTFQLEAKSTNDKSLCAERDRSYKLMLHLPNELPQISYEAVNIPMGKEQSIMITAEISSAEDSLWDLTPDSRGCYLNGENELKFFKSYTKANCEYECLANFTYTTCGCVKISMPRTKDMKFCNFTQTSCIWNIKDEYLKNYYKDPENRKQNPCGCLPSCTEIKYKVMRVEKKDTIEKEKDLHSTTKVIFVDSQIKKTSRFVTSKMERFIIYAGSSVGLFLGFAILIELFLYICKLIIKHGGKVIEMYHARLSVESANQDNNYNISFENAEIINLPEILVSNDQGEELRVEDLE